MPVRSIRPDRGGAAFVTSRYGRPPVRRPWKEKPRRGRHAPARFVEQLGHAAAVLELHDGVGGAVGFEVAQHGHDVRMAEARQRPRLVEEAIAAPGEIVGVAGAARHHLAVAATHGELDRQVLLDGHELRELRVEGAIGDPETAMADRRIEPVVAETRARGQSLDVVEGHGHAQPAP